MILYLTFCTEIPCSLLFLLFSPFLLMKTLNKLPSNVAYFSLMNAKHHTLGYAGLTAAAALARY